MATASARLPASSCAASALDGPLVLGDHRPFEPRTSAQRNGSATVPRSRFDSARAASTGVVRGPSFIFCFIPIARSIGGCSRHVTLVPGPPTAS